VWHIEGIIVFLVLLVAGVIWWLLPQKNWKRTPFRRGRREKDVHTIMEDSINDDGGDDQGNGGDGGDGGDGGE